MPQPAEDHLGRARTLYFEARYADCIEACRRVRSGGTLARSEVPLLMARAMLRSGKFAQAQEVLLAGAPEFAIPDAKVTATILHAMVRIERGVPDDALDLLRVAVGDVSAAHRAVRAELELARACAYFAKRDYRAALQHVLPIRPDADVLHAQALELQARCYHALGKKRDAATSFVAALVRLDACRVTDRGLCAAAVSGLSRTAFELTDTAFMQVVESRYAMMEWPPDVWADRCIAAANISGLAVFRGDINHAADYALRSLVSATSDALRLSAYVALARSARHGADRTTPLICIRAAQRLLHDWSERATDGAPFAPETVLDVIAETVIHDPARARGLFERYEAYREHDSRSGENDDLLRGRERYVEGRVFEAEGRAPLARRCLVEAWQFFRETDSTLYAIETAYGLAMLGDDAMYWYACGALAGMQNWMTDGLKRRASSTESVIALTEQRRVVLARLTPAQREVVQLVCAGRSNPEIARLRKTTVQTVKNLLTSQVYPAFAVANRSELRAALADVLLPTTSPEATAANPADTTLGAEKSAGS